MSAPKTDSKEAIDKLQKVLDGLYDGLYPSKTHALLDNRLYRQKLDRWKNDTHKDNKTIVALIKEINRIGEHVLYKSTLDNTVNPTAGLFGLKAQYNWVEKSEAIKAEALESIITKQLKYQGSKYPLCSFVRMRKFIKRGWHINAGEILKIAFNLQEFDLTDVEVLEDQLTGVDTAYFLQLISKIKLELEKNKDFQLDRAYLTDLIERIF